MATRTRLLERLCSVTRTSTSPKSPIWSLRRTTITLSHVSPGITPTYSTVNGYILCAASSASAVTALAVSPAERLRFMAKSMTRVLLSVVLHGIGEVGWKGSRVQFGDSIAIARVEVGSLISCGAGVCAYASTQASSASASTQTSTGKRLCRTGGRHVCITKTALFRVFTARICMRLVVR